MDKRIEEAVKNKKYDPKSRNEINKKNAEIKNLNQKLADNIKKVRDETNLRSKSEADTKAKDDIIETLKEIIALQKISIQQAGVSRPASPQKLRGRSQDKRTELCRDFLRQGVCFRGHKCKFFHPPGRNQPSSQSNMGMKPDCKYWLEGYCRKRENQCWGRHDPNMCGTQHKQTPHVTGSRNNIEANDPDFVRTLAKAVSQSLVRVQPGVPDPSRGQQVVQDQSQDQMRNQQNMTMSQQQQPPMIPMMMTPNGQCLFFPAQQGGPGLGQ